MNVFAPSFCALKSSMNENHAYLTSYSGGSVKIRQLRSGQVSNHVKMARESALFELKNHAHTLHTVLLEQRIISPCSGWSIIRGDENSWSFIFDECYLAQSLQGSTDYGFKDQEIIKFLHDISVFLKDIKDEGILHRWGFDDNEESIFAANPEYAVLKKIIFEHPHILSLPNAKDHILSHVDEIKWPIFSHAPKPSREDIARILT